MIHLYFVSWWSWCTTFFSLDDQWGPLSSIRSICSRDRSLPQTTNHPYCAYPFRRGIASWCTAYSNYGHRRPSKDLPIVAWTDISVGMLSLSCNFSESYFSHSIRVIAIFGSGCTCVCFFCFCGGMINSVVSFSDLLFVLTVCRSVMCCKRFPGTHLLITGNHYATTHIQIANKVNELKNCAVWRNFPYSCTVSILRTCSWHSVI